MRLVTRSDFDGLACSVLLKELGLIDDYLFAHPKDIQDGLITVSENDILANVPYVPGCGMWFDHHSSEQTRLGKDIKFVGMSKPLKSCARVIWEYYGGDKKFSKSLHPMLEAVDKVDSATLTAQEIADPKGWILLGFIMDPRTGLGRFKDFRISNYQLMLDMIEYCRTHKAEDILKLQDVQERVDIYREQSRIFVDMLRRNSTQHGNLVLTDLRGEEAIHAGNRFLIYTLFLGCNISMQIMWGVRKQNVVITVGHSILKRNCKTNVGRLMLEYGGGGHDKVGTCQVPAEGADAVIDALMKQITANG
ncbi:MAG: exopolyphosphatase [Humidesulfovibrio sp.]|uniref:exopolyphosphatase n=1 Tax=Humidesulfovibrio sp. TaxID=2910988 RepID=UPI0027FA4495|nr:exopolyphosphatase [Humidesulfovibrio sp.]MDQ7834037.1 exopolyphosphatase [Humidesulfovibrio sp.]